MALPERIGGNHEKSTLVIGVGLPKKRPSGMPSRIGGSSENDEPEGTDEEISHDQAMDDAADELISELQRMKPSRDRVKAALRAFFYACDAEPHDEGEHTEEESDEYGESE
jgi:hypothetical protein